MNLSQIDILLKSRTNIQAINLGFVTARRYKGALLAASFIAILPVFIIASLLIIWFDAYIWGSLLLWWCKPFYDRVILDNASRLLFREPLTLASQIESLGRATKNGLWLNLTLYRFSPIRHVTLPIFLLEKLRGKDYQQRVKLVSKGSSSSATMGLIGLLHIEMVLYINCYLLIAMFAPESLKGDNLGDFFDYISRIEAGWLAVGLLTIQFLCMMIVEVFFVMTGFMIYLNNRVKTEGWDIELGFKQMAERLAAMQQVIPSLIVVAMIAVTAIGYSPAVAANEAPATVAIDTQGDKAILKQILLEKNIDPYRTQSKWVRKKPLKETKKKIRSDYSDYSFGNLSSFANIIKFSLVILALFILYWLVVNRHKFAGFFQVNTVVEPMATPDVMFGLDLRRETLPSDIAAEARRLLKAGKKTAALSLLYRGSLSLLISDYQVKISESDTEGDCLAATQTIVSTTIYQYFKQITQCWQRMVYAHQSIEKSTIEQLIEQWHKSFVATSSGTTPLATGEATR